MLPDHTGVGAVPLCPANAWRDRNRVTPATSPMSFADARVLMPWTLR